ncbi:MAG: sigma-70 family RNA polymerase sigma factor [Candidatus Eisenbacteria bacterium]|nr:sigma-70 family RNA polymerase sigma factor [Candidatus Eisenbacteria bacterium]
MASGFTGALEPAPGRGGKRISGSRKAARTAEAKLVAAARKGDRRALNELFKAAAAPALRFSRVFCRDPHEAEDLAQDVMATLLRTLPRFRGDASLSTWTYTVARRACGRRRQRLARERPLAEVSQALEAAPPEAGPLRSLERRQLGEALERAIAALPAAQRDVVVLRDVEGLTAAEVGRILGIGERAVKSRLHRARLALRERLAPFAAGGDAPPRNEHCPDTARMLSRYVEGELSSAVCARMERHVASCPACAAACASLRAVLGACRDYGRKSVPPEIRLAVRTAVKDLLQEARRK